MCYRVRVKVRLRLQVWVRVQVWVGVKVRVSEEELASVDRSWSSTHGARQALAEKTRARVRFRVRAGVRRSWDQR